MKPFNYRKVGVTLTGVVLVGILTSCQPKEIGINEQEMYKIEEVNLLENGDIEAVYLYDKEELQGLLSTMESKEILERLGNWEYSDNPDLKTPLDVLEGKSNCQGVTLFVLEALNNKDKQNKLDFEIVELDKNAEEGHVYLKVINDVKTYNIDLARDYESSLNDCKEIIRGL